MKKLIKLVSVTLATGFILVSCEGPMGKDANETCKECHNPTVVDQKVVEFKFSKHQYGEAAFEEAGNITCAPCHESEGFKYVCQNNTPATFSLNGSTYANNYIATTSIAYGELSCFTCHSSLHTTYSGDDFLPLTTTAAVPLSMWGGAKTIDLAQQGGKSNLCLKCHQPRPFTNSNGDKNVLNYAGLVSNPNATFYDVAQSNSLNVLKPSYRTHPHYGTAGAIFGGQGGVEFPGTLSYTSSKHTTDASCQDCHMAPITGRAGGHTFVAKGNFNGCTSCHPTVTASSQDANYWATPRAEIKKLLDDLAAKLTINGVDILNRNGDAESNLWLSLTKNKYDGYLNIYDPITNPSVQTYNTKSFQYIGTPPDAWSIEQKAYNATLPKITLKNVQMGALINFQLCLRDYSLGIHNYKYTKALLKNTIDALTLAGV